MAHYVKCPRCELNYIDADQQEYCDVCLREMKGILSDADEADEDEIPMEVCPICGENMMRVGEKMCDECKKKAEYEVEEPDPDDDDDDEWREYLDDDTDDLDEEMGKLDEAMSGDLDVADEEEEEEEEEYHDDDEEDLDYVTGDEIYSISGDDDDDDDDEDDDF